MVEEENPGFRASAFESFSEMNSSLSFSNFGSSFVEADEEGGSHCINVADRLSGSACSAVTNALSFSFAFAASEAKTSNNPLSLVPGPGRLSEISVRRR